MTRIETPAPETDVAGWQDISTAPLDGREVLGITFQAQRPTPIITKFEAGKWLSHSKGKKFVVPGWSRWWPTHWRPLDGPHFKPIPIDPEDAALLNARNYTIENYIEAARSDKSPPPETSATDLSDEELLAELRNRRHRFSPDEYMSQDQCDDRAKLGVLRHLIVSMYCASMHNTGKCPEWLQTLHSKCDELDSIYGNPLPARAFAVNTTLPGREDTYETHQSGMPVAAVDVWR